MREGVLALAVAMTHDARRTVEPSLPGGLEPVGKGVERAASATSKSPVSRRFGAMTETALAALLAAPLGSLVLAARTGASGPQTLRW